VGKRRKGREIVLQSLYAARLSGASLDDALADQLERRRPSNETADFATGLLRTLGDNLRQTDRWLGQLLQNWDPERVGVLEKAILAIGLTELRHCPDVPWRVVIDEACELARRYCDEEAVGFVNGILDRAATQVVAGPDGTDGEPPASEEPA
jgi:N utilization substance protein B